MLPAFDSEVYWLMLSTFYRIYFSFRDSLLYLLNNINMILIVSCLFYMYVTLKFSSSCLGLTFKVEFRIDSVKTYSNSVVKVIVKPSKTFWIL